MLPYLVIPFNAHFVIGQFILTLLLYPALDPVLFFIAGEEVVQWWEKRLLVGVALLGSIAYLCFVNLTLPINAKDKFGNTALIVASIFGNEWIVRFLLNYKKQHVDVNWQANNGVTALIVAVMYGRKNIVALLLNYEKQLVDINLQTRHGRTVLMVAARVACNMEIVEMLLYCKNHQVYINSQDHNGFTPLMLAVQSGKPENVMLILKYDKEQVDINIQNYFGETALMLSAISGNNKIVAMLLNYEKQQVDVNQADFYGYTALMNAVICGYYDVVAMLLAYDKEVIDVHVKCKCPDGGNTPLMLAAKNGYTDICRLLLQQKYPKHLRNYKEHSSVLSSFIIVNQWSITPSTELLDILFFIMQNKYRLNSDILGLVFCYREEHINLFSDKKNVILLAALGSSSKK